MSRASIVLLLGVALSAATVAAADPAPSADDPLQSAACRKALDALQAQEAAVSGAPQASATGQRGEVPGPAYAAARRQAAIACLASRADPPPQPQRLAQPPVVVAPLTGARPLQPLVPPAGRLPSGAPPPTAEPPHFVLSCDSAGCWANDGTRLNRVGPNLWGSRGACTQQGALLQCP